MWGWGKESETYVQSVKAFCETELFFSVNFAQLHTSATGVPPKQFSIPEELEEVLAQVRTLATGVPPNNSVSLKSWRKYLLKYILLL